MDQREAEAELLSMELMATMIKLICRFDDGADRIATVFQCVLDAGYEMGDPEFDPKATH
jgi:hypothetical protein